MTTAQVLGWVGFGIIAAGFLVTAAAMTVLAFYARRFYHDGQTHRLKVEADVGVAAANAEMTDAQLRTQKKSIDRLPDAVAEKVIPHPVVVIPPAPPPVDGPPVKGAGGFRPPALPGTPAEPAPVHEAKQPPRDDPRGHPPGNGSGSRAGSFLTLLAVGLGGLSAGPLSPPEAYAMTGQAQFRQGRYKAAAKTFTEAGDRHRAAESLLAAQDLDGAVAKLDGLHDARSEYLRGMVADARGDHAAAQSLYVLARDKGEPFAHFRIKGAG